MKQAMRLESEAMDHLEELVQRVEALETQIQQIFERNQKVEADKSWESSGFRVAVIGVLTYIFTASVFYLVGVDRYLVSACVPTLGYLLSCLSLHYLRWIAASTKPGATKKESKGDEH